MYKYSKGQIESNRRFARTPRGVLCCMYHNQIKRGIARGYGRPTYSLDWLYSRFLDDVKYNRLYSEWVKSGFKKERKPSIDRISRNKPYTPENVQILTWAENRFKQNTERRSRKGKVLQLKDGTVISTFLSQRDAVGKTGISQSRLSRALLGGRTLLGFEWKYLNSTESGEVQAA